MVTLVTMFEVLEPVGLIALCVGTLAGLMWWAMREDLDDE